MIIKIANGGSSLRFGAGYADFPKNKKPCVVQGF
jgi:hypothetical protein